MLLTRPFEAVLLVAIVFPYVIAALVRHKSKTKVVRLSLAFVLTLVPGVALTLAHNHNVTGDRRLLPHQTQLSDNTVFRRHLFFTRRQSSNYELTPRQMVMYKLQRGRHDAFGTVSAWLTEISERLSLMYEFFWGPSLLLSLVGLVGLGVRLLFWPILLLAASLVGSLLYGFYFPQCPPL